MNSGKYLYSGTASKKVPSSKKVSVSLINQLINIYFNKYRNPN